MLVVAVRKIEVVTNMVSVHEMVTDMEFVVPLWQSRKAVHDGTGGRLGGELPGIDDMPKVNGSVGDEGADWELGTDEAWKEEDSREADEE